MTFLPTDDSIDRPYMWWRNFSNHIGKETNDNHEIYLASRNKKLLKYGAVAVPGGIKFETEEQATWFLLRWS